MAREAPNAAPEEIPKIYGLAIGFLNNPCIAHPAVANEAPIIAASKILGNLISKIIDL